MAKKAKKPSNEELLLEFGITSNKLSRVLYDLRSEKGRTDFLSPYEEELLIVEALFPKKSFSKKEKDLLHQMLDDPYTGYAKKNEHYRKALEFSKKFPEIWKVASEVLRVYDLVRANVEGELKENQKILLDKLTSNSAPGIITRVLVGEKIRVLWDKIQTRDKNRKEYMKQLKQILEKPEHKNMFIENLILDSFFSGLVKGILHDDD